MSNGVGELGQIVLNTPQSLFTTLLRTAYACADENKTAKRGKTMANVSHPPERDEIRKPAVDRLAHPGQQRGQQFTSHDILVSERVRFREKVRRKQVSQLLDLGRELWRHLTLRNLPVCARASTDEQGCEPCCKKNLNGPVIDSAKPQSVADRFLQGLGRARRAIITPAYKIA